jgi:glycosyltransferase involved in cell wall biosynthesis
MRILHVASTWAQGGIASSLWHLLPDLRAHGFDIEIAGLYEVGLYGERLAAHGIRAQHLGFASKYAPRALAQFVRRVQGARFDIVHTHGWPAIFFGAVAAQFARGTRFFVTEHSSSNRRRRYHLGMLERQIYRRYACIIPVSYAAAEGLHGWLPETDARASMIYNGISFERLGEVPSNKAHSLLQGMTAPVILSASGSETHKGADVLIETLGAQKDTRDFTLALAGAGRHDADLWERVKRAGLETRTRRLGYVPDVHLLMRDADVLVVPSRREGCPMVILEAMAMETPIVASAVGGIPELVEDGKSARLVPPDNPDGLGRALDEVLRDRAEAGRLSRAARERIEQFSARRQAAQVAELYRQR